MLNGMEHYYDPNDYNKIFYYNASNEGHIFCKLTNDTKENKTVSIEKGQGMVQGIFLSFGVTIDDDTVEERVGGIGSTTKKVG